MAGRPKNFQQTTADIKLLATSMSLWMGSFTPGASHHHLACASFHIEKWQGHSTRTSNLFQVCPALILWHVPVVLCRKKNMIQWQRGGEEGERRNPTLNNKLTFTPNSQLCSCFTASQHRCPLHPGALYWSRRYYIPLLQKIDTGICSNASFFSRINKHDECFRHELLPFRLRCKQGNPIILQS